MKSKQKGITLIALVITIIVLLILAGVSIAMLTGENGILTQAQKAKEQTEKASEEEQRQLTIAEATMNLNGTKYKSTYNGKEVTVPIPAGFAVSQVDGENTVEDGLVIIDSEGNEFVWIPVESKENYKKKLGSINFYGEKLLDDISSIDEIQVGDNLGVTNILGTKIESGIQNQPESNIVVDAGGFYVGRYEAGIETNEIIDWNDSPEIVVKRNVQPISEFGWQKVLQLANNWKIEQNVQSGLITGTQWDVMCNFIGFETANGDCSDWGCVKQIESSKYTGYCKLAPEWKWLFAENIIKNSGETGLFPTGMFLTKAGKDTSRKNIYDIVGNVQELTTEFYKNSEMDVTIERGCDAGFDLANCSAMMRLAFRRENWAESGWADGFRIVLYVK